MRLQTVCYDCDYSVSDDRAIAVHRDVEFVLGSSSPLCGSAYYTKSVMLSHNLLAGLIAIWNDASKVKCGVRLSIRSW